MKEKNVKKDRSFWSIIGIATLAGSLCCLTPVVLVLFGLSTVAFASTLGDALYGGYKWLFRGFALLLLALGLFFYFRKKGICTLDQAKRRRNEIINKVLIAVLSLILGYIFFLYVVVHYIGVWLNIW